VNATVPEAPKEDFQKHVEIQREFWVVHKQPFLFNHETVIVNIKQCILAKDEYVILAL